jgi:hypothetical protein
MQQVSQNIRNGKLSLMEVPDPVVRPGQLLIANARSVISAGTEKRVMQLAKKSLPAPTDGVPTWRSAWSVSTRRWR